MSRMAAFASRVEFCAPADRGQSQEAPERLQYAAVSMIRAGAGIAAPKHWFLSNAVCPSGTFVNPLGFVSSTSDKLTWKTISTPGGRLTTGEGAWEAA
jgi:hypothetical protein